MATFIDFQSRQFSRESVYKEDEIKWLMEILYAHHKNQKKTIESTRGLIMICANGDLGSLYQLRETLESGGIIKKKHRRGTDERSVATK